MKRKVSKKTKMFVDAEGDPEAPGPYSTNWQGRIYILDPETSVIAQKLNMVKKGEYAIKVR